MPVVIFFVFLDLEPDSVDFETLVNQQTHTLKSLPSSFDISQPEISTHQLSRFSDFNLQMGRIMDSSAIFTTALQYEEKIRDLYYDAANSIDDERGKIIFKSLGDDEQSHVDFLNYSLKQLQANLAIDAAQLQTTIPALGLINDNIEKLKAEIPKQMLGDIKTVLNNALKLEKETSNFYRDARDKTEGPIRDILNKFLEIEERHVDVVQIEIDHAMNNGMWFNFMEINLEME